MENEGKSSSILPLSVLILAFGLGGIYLYDQPYSSFRPAGDPVSMGRRGSIEDVDARLWEDPFRAVSRVTTPSPCVDWSFAGVEASANREGTGDEEQRTRERRAFLDFQESASRQLIQLAYEVRRKAEARLEPSAPPVLLMPVLVPGEPYFEQAEKRRRTRYAVLAALAASGYVPEASDHIGLVDTCWSFAGRLHPTAGRPVPMPYEWLVPDSLRSGETDASAVLVLWLDESEFGAHPWVRIDDLLTHVIGYCHPSPRGPLCLDETQVADLFSFRLIGPASSGVLARMATTGWTPRQAPHRVASDDDSDSDEPREKPANPAPFDSFEAFLEIYLDAPEALLGAFRGSTGTSPLRGVVNEEVEHLVDVIWNHRNQSTADLGREVRKAANPLRATLESHDPDIQESDGFWATSVTSLWAELQVEKLVNGGEPLREIVKPATRLCSTLRERGLDARGVVRSGASAGGEVQPSANGGEEPDASCTASIVGLDDLTGRCSEAESLVDQLSCRMLRHHLKPDRAISLSERAGNLASALSEVASAWPGRKDLGYSREDVPEIVALWAVRHRFEVLGQIEPREPVVPRLSIYNYRATAPPSLLARSADASAGGGRSGIWMHRLADRLATGALGAEGDGGLSAGSANFRFVPVVRHDDQLAPVLVEELSRRKLDLCDPGGKDHVALIGEWDTFYGRALPLTVEAAIVHCRDGWRVDRAAERGIELARRFRTLDSALLALVDGRIEPPSRVERYHYLRGLDGVAPAVDAAGKMDRDVGAEGDDDPTPLDRGFAGWLPGSSFGRLERPRGDRQFDYMRRLAGHLSRHHEEIQNQGGELRAIGVVGTDTYDKLLVLQALRRHFSRTLFFTTDLDARMLHPADHRWNRNLIIASSYGLRLHRSLQPHTPPFRDNYQSAAFLAVRLALEGSPRERPRGRTMDLSVRGLQPASWTVSTSDGVDGGRRNDGSEELGRLHDELVEGRVAPSSRLFEVARNGFPFDISVGGGRAGAGTSSSSVHPVLEKRTPGRRTLGLLGGISVLGFLLLIPLSPSVRRFTLSRWTEKDESARFAVDLFVVVVVVSAAIFAWLVHTGAGDPGGEPFSLLDGVSIWPTEAIRLVAALLAVFCLGFGIMRLERNAGRIARRYGLPVTNRSEPPGCWRQWWTTRNDSEKGSRGRGWLRKFRAVHPRGFRSLFRHALSWPREERAAWWREMDSVSVNAWRCAAGGARSPDRPDGEVEPEVVDGEEAWRRYLYLGRAGHRFTRILPVALLYFVLGRFLILLFGEPHLPHRGDLSFVVDQVILMTGVGLTILLTFFVVDATRLCERFIDALAELPTQWPEEAEKKMAQRRHINEHDAGDMIDLELIADRTEVVGNLILYPFVVIFLMIVSRASVFDNWDWPPGLLLILGLSSAYALMCGLVLRRASERARRKTIEHLRGNLHQALAEEKGPDGPRSAQIRLLIEEAQSLRRGAFAHWTHHPVVKAVLLPFSGVGVLALIELLSVMGR